MDGTSAPNLAFSEVHNIFPPHRGAATDTGSDSDGLPGATTAAAAPTGHGSFLGRGGGVGKQCSVCGTWNPGFSSNAKLNHDYCRGCKKIQPFAAAAAPPLACSNAIQSTHPYSASCGGSGKTLLKQALQNSPSSRAASSKRGEEGPVCGRFPALPMCGCTIPCRIAAEEVTIDRVVEGLYIGPVQAAYMDAELESLGVRAVINASRSEYTPRPQIRYLVLNVEDSEDADLGSELEKCVAFIARNSPVLVHCHAGKSRSATICAAYLMATEGLGADEAILRVRQAHPRADPNRSFRQQLAELERTRERSSTSWLANFCPVDPVE